jgi:hypothetical protein
VDCDSAALSGENLKKLMGWPDWKTEPSRVKKLLDLLRGARQYCVEGGCSEEFLLMVDEAIK